MNENIAQQLLEEMKEIKSNMASMQGDVNNLENNMTSVQENVNSIESNMTSVQENVNSIESNMASVQENVNNLENNMTSMQENVNSIESSMATKHDVERIDNQLYSITKHVVHNSEQLSKLSEKQELKQLETINDSQERQEKILDTLALRSIEQERASKDTQRAKSHTGLLYQNTLFTFFQIFSLSSHPLNLSHALTLFSYILYYKLFFLSFLTYPPRNSSK